MNENLTSVTNNKDVSLSDLKDFFCVCECVIRSLKLFEVRMAFLLSLCLCTNIKGLINIFVLKSLDSS